MFIPTARTSENISSLPQISFLIICPRRSACQPRVASDRWLMRNLNDRNEQHAAPVMFVDSALNISSRRSRPRQRYSINRADLSSIPFRFVTVPATRFVGTLRDKMEPGVRCFRDAAQYADTPRAALSFRNSAACVVSTWK